METFLQQIAKTRHDLRTPVNAILGYSEMLMEEAEDNDATILHDQFQNINRLGKDILREIQRLLGEERFSSAESFDLKTLSDELQNTLSPVTQQIIANCQNIALQNSAEDFSSYRSDWQRILRSASTLKDMLQNPVAEVVPAPTVHPTVIEQEYPTICTKRLPRGHILVVDDQESNRDILSRLLVRENLTIEEAVNGRDALDKLRSRPFDLVLLDVIMPEVDGYTVLAQLKTDDQLKHVPVIMISALDDISSVVRCIEMGAEDYLPKPFDPVLLRARLGACLEQKRLRDQELDYLRNVAIVTHAAAAMEAGHFRLDEMDVVSKRSDPLGQLARVFQSMAREVEAREERLKMQVMKLKVEVDEARKSKQVRDITESQYFQSLQNKAASLRRRKPREG